MLHAEEQTIDIDRHHAVPVGQGDLLDAGGAVGPGIGDHDIEPPVIGAHSSRCRLPIRFLRHIELEVVRRRPQPVQHGRHFRRARIGQIRQHHPGTLGQEPLHRRKADPAQRAGDQRDTPFQPPHHAVLGNSPEMYLSIVLWNCRMRVS